METVKHSLPEIPRDGLQVQLQLRQQQGLSAENLGGRPNFEMHRHEDEGERKMEAEPREHKWGRRLVRREDGRNTGLKVITQAEQWDRD